MSKRSWRPAAVVAIACANLLAFHTGVAIAQTTSADQALYENFHQLLDQDKSGDALTLLNTTIAANGTPMAYTLRCEVYTRLQKYDIAAPDCAKALQLAPTFALVHQTEGDRLYDSGDLQGSLKEYDAYLALNPSDAAGYWRRCDARRRLSDWAGAQADCDKAIAAYPKNPKVRISRGHIELQNKAYDKAYADFDFAVSALPGNTIALYWRGYTALQLNRYDQAVADFTAAIKNGDEAPDTYSNRALAYLALGKKDLARADWEKAIALDQKYGQCEAALQLAIDEMVKLGVHTVGLNPLCK